MNFPGLLLLCKISICVVMWFKTEKEAAANTEKAHDFFPRPWASFTALAAYYTLKNIRKNHFCLP